MIMIKIESYAIGPVSTNCYIAVNTETKECFIVDPAVCPEQIVSHIKEEGWIPKAILLTHAHFDHISGIDGFLLAFDMPVYVHEADEEMLRDPKLNMSTDICRPYAYNNALCVKDRVALDIAGFKIQVLFTPGHTPGGCCYYIADEHVVFSGDTLFCMSVGRSDFPGGDAMQLSWSIQEKLMNLPEETKVYPGHMEETTIGFEKENNPYL